MNIEELIGCIFVKNALWDQKDPQHHNRHVLDKLWDAVAMEMKSTRSIVKTKWKTLRDSYRKELNKLPIKRSGDGACQAIKSSWKYFDTLSFLKDQFTARSSGGNLPDTRQNNISQEVSLNSKVSERNEQDHGDCVRDTQAEAEIIAAPLSTSTVASAHKRAIKRKQKNYDDITTALVKIEETKLKILQSQQPTNIHDEDSSFFDSLLPHVRALPPQKKMLLRMKLQEMVYCFIYEDKSQNIPNVFDVQEITTQTQTYPRNFGDNSRTYRI